MLALTLQSSAALAGTFEVSPIQLFLSDKAKSGLLTLTNSTDQSIRFQLSMFAWGQHETGEMDLKPTKDLVFFPPLLTLAPREKRNIRIGVEVPFAAVEKTYRIFVEELPPLSTAATAKPTQIRVLTKMGVPIFLQAGEVAPAGRIEAISLQPKRVSFSLHNAGNGHFVAGKIKVSLLDAAGGTLEKKELNGWYVLAKGTRRYELDYPDNLCAQVKSIAVEVQTQAGLLEGRLEAPAGACTPSR